MTKAEWHDGDDITMFVVVTTLLRYRWRIVRWMLVGGVVAAVFASLRPALYAASASFVPQRNDPQVSRLASLAGQFGVSLATGNQAQSPDFYENLLNSRVILAPIARESLVVQEMEGDRIAFWDLFKIEEESAKRREDKGIRTLETLLRTSVDNTTGIVRLSVATRWPSVSLAIANALIEGVNEFNRRSSQEEAAAERMFIEGRLEVAQTELRDVEDRLEQFLMTNRQFNSSPQLIFQRDRLQRDLLSRQQVVTSLTQSYEEARIREVRNTSVITLIEAPSVPALAEPRGRLLRGVMGVALGGLIGVVIALGSGMINHGQRTGNSEVNELVATVAEVKGEVLRPGKWLRARIKR